MHHDISTLPNGSPFALIQNLYDSSEHSEIMQELRYLHSRSSIWLDPDESGSAKDAESKQNLKNNKCIWMNKIYKNPEASAILTHNMKLYNSGLAMTLAESHPWFKYLIHNAEFSTLLSYYENNQDYKPHRDRAVLTTLTWFYEEPKYFEGGNLFLEKETKVECLNNFMVIIPSTVLHEVTPVILDEEFSNKGFGRYTITTFITTIASQS